PIICNSTPGVSPISISRQASSSAPSIFATLAYEPTGNRSSVITPRLPPAQARENHRDRETPTAPHRVARCTCSRFAPLARACRLGCPALPGDEPHPAGQSVDRSARAGRRRASAVEVYRAWQQEKAGPMQVGVVETESHYAKAHP